MRLMLCDSGLSPRSAWVRTFSRSSVSTVMCSSLQERHYSSPLYLFFYLLRQLPLLLNVKSAKNKHKKANIFNYINHYNNFQYDAPAFLHSPRLHDTIL